MEIYRALVLEEDSFLSEKPRVDLVLDSVETGHH